MMRVGKPPCSRDEVIGAGFCALQKLGVSAGYCRRNAAGRVWKLVEIAVGGDLQRGCYRLMRLARIIHEGLAAAQ